MKDYTVQIDHNGQDLAVNQGILEYVADINPSTEWAVRGYKATNYDADNMQDFQENMGEKLDSHFDEEMTEDLNDFVEETLRLYENLIEENFEPIYDIVGDKDVYFITGPPRTGGTFLLKSLIEILNKRLENFHHKLISDHLPKSTQMGSNYGQTHTSQCLFEWAQWFVWMRRNFDMDTFKYIPKKHIGVLNQLQLFENILGDQVNYIITSRPPGEAYQSYVERFLTVDGEVQTDNQDVGLWRAAVIPRTNLDEERWEELELPDQFLLYWCACYLEVLNYGNEDRLTVLKWGKEYSEFLQEFAQRYDRLYFPEEFAPTRREELPEFSDHCLEMKDKVETLWKEKFGKELY